MIWRVMQCDEKEKGYGLKIVWFSSTWLNGIFGYSSYTMLVLQQYLHFYTFCLTNLTVIIALGIPRIDYMSDHDNI